MTARYVYIICIKFRIDTNYILFFNNNPILFQGEETPTYSEDRRKSTACVDLPSQSPEEIEEAVAPPESVVRNRSLSLNDIGCLVSDCV